MAAPDPDPLYVPEDEPPKSGFVILYLAVILVAIATGAIIALLWWGLR